jgi:hypothetical protein
MSAGCATAMPIDRDFDSIKAGVVQPVSNSPKPPDWVLGREHNSFRRAEYLVGVGFSKENTVSASESARAELSKNIRFKIASVMKDYNSNDGSFIESFVKTETDTLLEGVQIKDGWYDSAKKVFYSLAVVKRKNVLAMIQDQVDIVVSTIDLTMNQANTFHDNGEVLKSLVYYYDGYNESSKLLPLLRTYKSVSLFPEIPAVSNNIPSAIDFKKKVQSIVSNIEVEKIDDLESFVVKITYDGQALRNLPIKFYGNSYNFVSRVSSNDKGICKVKTNNVTVEDDFAIVKAEVDLFTLSRRFNHKLKKDLFGRLDTLDVTFKKFKEYKFQFSLDKKKFEVGQEAVFFVQSNVSGYLTIHSQRMINDTPTKVFPNPYLKDNYIQKNKIYNIGGAGYPFHFRITGPPSQEVVTAVLYKDEDLTKVLSQKIYEYSVVMPYVAKKETHGLKKGRW